MGVVSDLLSNMTVDLIVTLFWLIEWIQSIRRRSDYIIGFIAPAIGPNKSKKLTRLIAPVHNIRDKVWMKKKHIDPTLLQRQTVISCKAMYVVFHSNFAAYIVWLDGAISRVNFLDLFGPIAGAINPII